MLNHSEKIVRNIKLSDMEPQPVKELTPLCRKMAAEGSVLLKNENILPFKKEEKVAVFGRIQETYYKSGTGSGGDVNCKNIPCIIESLLENGVFSIDTELADVYKSWVSDHPFDAGEGWAKEPWCQKEMPVTNEFVKEVSGRNDSAVIIIGRTAGEDKDNAFEKGSYFLTDEEENLIKTVAENFKKTAVVLNVGNLIDLSFVTKYNIPAVMYIWQGGGEGANALADILSGKISPSGKLPDTQVFNIYDNPVTKNFGNPNECVYEEDIYVGYRYFETFAKDKIMYPFGFGLTYSSFDISYSAAGTSDDITVTARVKNVGDFPAREVVQIYYDAPCGKLGTPAKQLIAFKKTKTLKKGEEQTLDITFKIKDMASYDDSGITGNAYCYVLESGEYKIYAGTNSSCDDIVYTYSLEKDTVILRLEQAMPPEKPFEKMVAVLDKSGNRTIGKRQATLRNFDLDEKIESRRPKTIDYTGDKGIKLLDVAEGKNKLDEFVAQMTDTDLANIVCGEGMCSPKVKPSTGGAIGGVTDSLLDLGIPAVGVTDGPSGLRIYKNYFVTSLPNGYVFASSFDDELTEEIFDYEGIELYIHNVDALLGPGMNIHRHPLCGRNFEYFSEDPLLSGKIAAAATRGLAKSGTSSTIKHFCCNNQEYSRKCQNVVVSERALREIYLKGFEIAVKEGKATALMTSYNSVNGYWAASNYELNQTILRDEWGYEGFVMTDWWAFMNCKGQFGTLNNLKAMVRAHNDIFMVCESSENKPNNIAEGINEGYITRGDLQFCAKNLLRYIMNTPTFERYVKGGCVKPDYSSLDESNLEETYYIENVESSKKYKIDFGKITPVLFVFDIISHTDKLAQTPITLDVYAEESEKGKAMISLSQQGTDGKVETVKRVVKFKNGWNMAKFKECENTLEFNFGKDIEIKKFTVKSEIDK